MATAGRSGAGVVAPGDYSSGMHPRSPSRRRAGAVLLLPLVVGLLLLVAPSPASAHTQLVGMSPADGSVVSQVPGQVVLTFDEAVENVGYGLVVTAPSGASVVDGTPVLDGAQLSQKLVPLTEPGHYTVSYRVVADDGHPVTGTRGFDLSADAVSGASAPATPAPSASSSASPAASTDPGIDSGSPATAMAIGVVLLALAGGLTWFVSSRRSAGPS